MTCAEFLDTVEALALGAVSSEERTAALAHLAEAKPEPHEGCVEAYQKALAVLNLLGDAVTPVRPPAGAWARIEEGVAAARAPAAAAASWQKWLPWAVAAALLLLLVLLDGGRRRAVEAEQAAARASAQQAVERDGERRRAADDKKRCEADLQAARSELTLRAEAVAMLELPATRVVALAPQAGATSHATAIVNLSVKKGMLIVGNLVAQPDKDYELWVIKGNDKKAAGLLRAGSGSTVVAIEAALLADGADALAVTLEPAGGGPTPRGPVVLVGALPKT